MSDTCAGERGPNYDWKHEAEHYRAECESLRNLLRKVGGSAEKDIYELRQQLAEVTKDRDRVLDDLAGYDDTVIDRNLKSRQLTEARKERDQALAEVEQFRKQTVAAVNVFAQGVDVPALLADNARLREALQKIELATGDYDDTGTERYIHDLADAILSPVTHEKPPEETL